MNDFIIRLFNIKTYETDYEKLLEAFKALRHETDILKGANDVLARKVVELEDKVETLVQDPDKYILQKLSEYKTEHNNRIRNRAFAEGRMAAYSELGIWRLDALERGNCLVRISNADDEIVELIADDLVDVVAEGHERVSRADVLNGEIPIDDLIDVGA